MTRYLKILSVGVLLVVPFSPLPPYVMHILVLILLWGFIYTAWSLMGRFGLVSLGHGAFLGIGAYVTTMLWNIYGLSPWLGAPIAIAAAIVVGLGIGYPCCRFKVVGHYFALVTLALGEVARLAIIAARDITGGSLGVGLEPATKIFAVQAPSLAHTVLALQFQDKRVFYIIGLGLFLFGVYVWHRVDSTMSRAALEAASQDETAAASIGVPVTWEKLKMTMVSAGLTALGGAAIGQYQAYINPETLSGVGVSLQIVFAAIVGGMYVALGPIVGAVLTVVLQEGLRIVLQMKVVGLDSAIYGLLLIIFIIFMPKGIVGSVVGRWEAEKSRCCSARARL